MTVRKCIQGHYFDDAKYPECPHCAAGVPGAGSHQDEKTVAKISSEKILHGFTQTLGTGGDPKTISIYQKKTGSNPVVGWLVCQDGPEKGRDYRLHSGRNFVGRADKMDVVIKDDLEISREDHCSVVYEPKSGNFMLVPGGQGTSTYLSGARLDEPKVISEGARIELGHSIFIFIPYCKGERQWL